VATAARLLEAEYCNIVLPDQNGRLVFRAGFGWAQQMIGNFPLEAGTGSQTGYTISKRRAVAVHDYRNRAARDFDVPPIVEQLGIRSGLSVPMFRGQSIVGSMLVHTLTPRNFDKDDIKLLELIANQTAIALESLERHKSSARQNAYLNAIYQGNRNLAVLFEAERKEVLQQILRLAVEGLTSIEGQKAFLGTIQLYDETTNELVLESVYPSEEHPHLVERIKERRSLDPELCGGKVGITGLTVLRGKPFVIPNVNEKKINMIYVSFDHRTQSELTVPLYYRGKVIGVLNVESDKQNAFDEDDQSALTTFSDMAVSAIKNAEQFAELKRSKGLVGARTALAWMGMASSNWRHVGVQKASAIRNNIFNIRQLAAGEQFRLPAEIDTKLLAIEQSAIEIMKDRPAPSLSADEVTKVHLNELVSERLSTLWDGEHKYINAHLEYTPATERLFVKGNAEWLQSAFDVLIDNAYYAVEDLPDDRRVISVEMKLAGGGVELMVGDKGNGIPQEILVQIFNKPIEKSKGDEERNGLGMGLLMAQAIIETYGGKLDVLRTGSEGTSMVIRLPETRLFLEK
jgi:GAF domain-containing protein